MKSIRNDICIAKSFVRNHMKWLEIVCPSTSMRSPKEQWITWKKVIIWLSQSPTASTVCNTTHGHVGFRLQTMLFLSSPELPNGCSASGAEASRPATVHTVISDSRYTVLLHFQTHLCNSSSSSSSKPVVSSVLEGPLHTWFIMFLD
jgi:hypothetical protein